MLQPTSKTKAKQQKQASDSGSQNTLLKKNFFFSVVKL